MSNVQDKSPAGAHYFNGQYIRTEGDIVKEYRGNHWEISDLSIEVLDEQIYHHVAIPLNGIWYDLLVTIFQILVIALCVGGFISLLH